MKSYKNCLLVAEEGFEARGVKTSVDTRVVGTLGFWAAFISFTCSNRLALLWHISLKKEKMLLNMAICVGFQYK